MGGMGGLLCIHIAGRDVNDMVIVHRDSHGRVHNVRVMWLRLRIVFESYRLLGWLWSRKIATLRRKNKKEVQNKLENEKYFK